MKLAILDKDGTLVLPKSGNTFVQNPTDQILMVGVVEGCQRLIEAGYVLAIASNQGGVEAGFKTPGDAIAEMQYCLQLLKSVEVDIHRALFCPDFQGKECVLVTKDYGADLQSSWGSTWVNLVGEFRKPSGGMLKIIAGNGYKREKFTDFWMIGDREEDRLAAEAAGFGFLDADEWRKGASPWII